jgi:hypothetical protein
VSWLLYNITFDIDDLDFLSWRHFFYWAISILQYVTCCLTVTEYNYTPYSWNNAVPDSRKTVVYDTVFRGNTRVPWGSVAFRERVVNMNSLYGVWPGIRLSDELRREAPFRIRLEKLLRPPDVRLSTASLFRKARFCTASCKERRVYAHFCCRFDLKLGEAGFGKCSNAEVAFRVKLTVVRTHFSVLFHVKCCGNRWIC